MSIPSIPKTPLHNLTTAQKLMFFAVVSSIFLAALDQTVVSTALPRIALDFHALSRLPWVVTGYLLTSTVSLPVYGKLGDLIGRKTMLLVAVVIFLLGSMLSGLAWSMDSLVFFRSLQGLGGGGIIVTAIASISDFIPLEERSRYQGFIGAGFGLAMLVGPFLGGLLVQTVGWRWIFYLNLPTGILSLYVIKSAFPERKQAKTTFDYWGTAGIVSSLTALVLLVEGIPGFWSQFWLALLLTAGLALFVWRGIQHHDPIIPLHFFRHRTFNSSVVVSFFVGVAMLGSLSFLPTYFQTVRGLNPTVSGLQLLFMLVGMVFTSVLVGRWTSKHKRFRYFPIVGTMLAAMALAILATISQITPFWEIHIALVLLGTGLGSTMQMVVLSAQWALPHRHLGVATSTTTLFRSIGGTLGVAGFGRLFSAYVKAGPPNEVATRIVAALHWNFGIAAVLLLLAFLAAWGLEDMPVLMARRASGGK